MSESIDAVRFWERVQKYLASRPDTVVVLASVDSENYTKHHKEKQIDDQIYYINRHTEKQVASAALEAKVKELEQLVQELTAQVICEDDCRCFWCGQMIESATTSDHLETCPWRRGKELTNE